MLKSESVDELQKFFQALEDRPLEPDDPKYVAELHQSPTMRLDHVEDYLLRLKWGDGTSASMISGQRGAGKSTELRRMQKRLVEAGHTVFLIDLSHYLNPNQPTRHQLRLWLVDLESSQRSCLPSERWTG